MFNVVLALWAQAAREGWLAVMLQMLADTVTSACSGNHQRRRSGSCLLPISIRDNASSEVVRERP